MKRWTCVKCGATHTGHTKGVLISQGDKLCKACWLEQHPRPIRPLVTTWLDQCCTPEPGTWTETGTLYASYQGWCETIDRVPSPYHLFTRKLRTLNYRTDTMREVPTTTDKNRKAWGVEGLHLNAQGIQNLRLK